MRWQGREISIGRRETRSVGYTDRLTQLLISQSTTVTETDPSRTAALEICAGIWGRAFASAKPEPEAAAQVLTPSVLNMVGRELIRKGEILFRISVADGRRVLTPASAWDVTGGSDPSSWQFVASFSGPDTESEATLDWAETALLTWAVEPGQPFKGLGPLEVADLTGSLCGSLEKSLSDEAATPHGFLMPVPQADEVDDDEVDPLAEMRADLKQLNGGLSLVETTYGGHGEGRGAAPQKDWVPSRLGPAVPDSLCKLREDVHRSVLSACGISPAMVGGRSDGTARREAYRTFAHLSLTPVGRMVSAELADKLDIPDLKFDWSALMAGDITGKARAFASLVKSGMDVTKAASLSGLMVE